MKTHIKSIGAITLLMLTLGCGTDEKNTQHDPENKVKVQVNRVEADNMGNYIYASGKIQSESRAEISTRIMGFVDDIPVKVGDKVKKGQLLMNINNDDLRARKASVNAGIAEATAAFRIAEKDYLRLKNLFAEKSATQKEFDDVSAHYEMAKARLESANQMMNEVNAQFAYVDIRSPFNGEVTVINVEKGDMANPGMNLISVEAPDALEVVVGVTANEVAEVRSGTEVDVVISSVGKTVKGKVTEVSSSARNTGGQFQVKIGLESPDKEILSGMYCTVKFPVKESTGSGIITVPVKAIVNKGELHGLYVVSQHETAVLRWLRLGRTYGEQVEVLSGLSSGEAYVISSEGKLYNGVKIVIQ